MSPDVDAEITFHNTGVTLTLRVNQPPIAHALHCLSLVREAEAKARRRGWPSRWYAARPSSQQWAGLDNQGATCYLNSLLQSLFICPDVRAYVYAFEYRPETHGAEEHCVPLQLARLFCRMQHSRRHVLSTRELTASFGWSEAEAHRQHDVQELCRVLFDALGKFGVPLAPRLFEGLLRDSLRCSCCGLESARREAFSDVPLDIAELETLEQALRHFVRQERMEGADAWRCGRCGARSSKKDTRFERLPELMMLHLKRFVFDRATMRRRKLNHRVSFPETLDMSPYVTAPADAEHAGARGAAPAATAEWYDCVGVLVHAGTAHGGHNFALLRPKAGAERGPAGDGWFEFNDSAVRRASVESREAAEGDGEAEAANGIESGSSCYMLLYRRRGEGGQLAAAQAPAVLCAEVEHEEEEAAQLRQWSQAADGVARLRVLPAHDARAVTTLTAR